MFFLFYADWRSLDNGRIKDYYSRAYQFDFDDYILPEWLLDLIMHELLEE